MLCYDNVNILHKIVAFLRQCGGTEDNEIVSIYDIV